MKQITLKTTVGGQFDFEAVRKALHEAGPLEPERDYVLRLSLLGEAEVVREAPAESAAPDAGVLSLRPPERVARSRKADAES